MNIPPLKPGPSVEFSQWPCSICVRVWPAEFADFAHFASCPTQGPSRKTSSAVSENGTHPIMQLLSLGPECLVLSINASFCGVWTQCFPCSGQKRWQPDGLVLHLLTLQSS